jgi:hypothetical protein
VQNFRCIYLDSNQIILDAFLQPQQHNEIKDLKYLMEKCAGKGATVLVFSSGGTIKNLTFSLDNLDNNN